MFKNEKNKILTCFFQAVFFSRKKPFFFRKKQACFFRVATLGIPHRAPGESPSQPTHKWAGWLGYSPQSGSASTRDSQECYDPATPTPGREKVADWYHSQTGLPDAENWLKALGLKENTRSKTFHQLRMIIDWRKRRHIILKIVNFQSKGNSIKTENLATLLSEAKVPAAPPPPLPPLAEQKEEGEETEREPTQWPPPTTPCGHAPQKEGGSDRGGRGGRLASEEEAEGDATKGEGRSLKGEQWGTRWNLPTVSQTQPYMLPRRPTGSRWVTPYTHICVQVLNKGDTNVPYLRPTNTRAKSLRTRQWHKLTRLRENKEGTYQSPAMLVSWR